MSDQISLSLRNFRSIESADIALNGITVVTGINGCGKSTISRTLYRLIRLSADYENIFIQRSKEIDLEWSFFDRVLNLVLSSDFPVTFRKLINKSVSSYKDMYLEYADQAIKKAQSLDSQKSSNLADKIKSVVTFDKESNLIQILEQIKERIRLYFQTLEIQINKHDISLLEAHLQNEFQQRIDVENCLTVKEKGSVITNWTNKTLYSLFYVDNVVYIDSPMAVGVSYDISNVPLVPFHWLELNKNLNNPPLEANPYSVLIDYIKTQIIHGSISRNELVLDDNKLSFTLENTNQSFDIEQCATGIKAFAAILLLLQTGTLNDRTLLILDEPEAHLHPEWVVEYARLLVLLHEKVKLRLFIASHDSDFVSALKNIADAKKLGENVVNFYLAKPNDERPVRYNYTRLNNNTGPIHKEFNNAFDLTDKYCDEFESEAAK